VQLADLLLGDDIEEMVEAVFREQRITETLHTSFDQFRFLDINLQGTV
jgi:hypothetical protein